METKKILKRLKVLHSEQRLAIIPILAGAESADFVYIRKHTGAMAGNLSVQLKELNKGLDALERYVDALKPYLPTL